MLNLKKYSIDELHRLNTLVSQEIVFRKENTQAVMDCHRCEEKIYGTAYEYQTDAFVCNECYALITREKFEVYRTHRRAYRDTGNRVIQLAKNMMTACADTVNKIVTDALVSGIKSVMVRMFTQVEDLPKNGLAIDKEHISGSFTKHRYASNRYHHEVLNYHFNFQAFNSMRRVYIGHIMRKLMVKYGFNKSQIKDLTGFHFQAINTMLDEEIEAQADYNGWIEKINELKEDEINLL